MRKMLRVNDVARELGVSEAWLRRAEKRGRIPHACRDMNGWRVYGEEDIASLRRVLLPAPSAPPVQWWPASLLATQPMMALAAKRNLEPVLISADAKLNQALAQLGDVSAEITCTSRSNDLSEEGIQGAEATRADPLDESGPLEVKRAKKQAPEK